MTTPMEPLELQVLAVEVLDAETELRTVTTSSGDVLELNVATGRLIVNPERLGVAVDAQLVNIGLRRDGAPQVLDEDPATQAWLTVRVPVASAEESAQ